MAIAQTSGSITANGGTVVLQSTGDPSTVINVYGTHSGITLVFEGTLDGTNWFGVPAFKLSTGRALPSGGHVLPANSSFGYYLTLLPWNKVRVRAATYGSGTLNVTMQVGPGAVFASPVMLVPQFTNVNTGLFTVQFTTGNAGATPLVTTGPGILHSIYVTTAGTVSTVFYDNPSTTTGTKLYASAATWPLATKASLNMYFANGITLNQVTGVAAGSLTYQLL